MIDTVERTANAWKLTWKLINALSSWWSLWSSMMIHHDHRDHHDQESQLLWLAGILVITTINYEDHLTNTEGSTDGLIPFLGWWLLLLPAATHPALQWCTFEKSPKMIPRFSCSKSSCPTPNKPGKFSRGRTSWRGPGPSSSGSQGTVGTSKMSFTIENSAKMHPRRLVFQIFSSRILGRWFLQDTFVWMCLFLSWIASQSIYYS